MRSKFALFAMMILAIVFSVDDIGASGYSLGIFGNANMDETIDESDIAYVKDIINGTSAPTNLSDANYDGKIDALDIDQINKVINRREERLTFLDATGEAETIRKPVSRIVTGWTDSTETLRALNAADKIVGIDPWTQKQEKFYPDISKLPAVSHPFTPDYEAVMSLHPDAVMPWVGRTYSSKDKNELKKNLPDISVVCLAFGFTSGEVFKENVMKLGYLIDKRDEAHSFIEFYDNIINGIWERTKDLADEEKPRAYVESYRKGSAYGAYRYIDLLDITGGKNIASDISGSEVDPEWVIKQNPDFIIIRLGGYGDYSGYEHDNSSEMIAARDEMLNRSELANVNGLKNGRVFMIDAGHLAGGPGHFLSALYFAKWLHPDLFKDLDPQAIHQEYLTRFQHLDFDLDKHGVFVYPPLK